MLKNKFKILVVDDDNASLTINKYLLKAIGYKNITAEIKASKILDSYNLNDYDVIATDLMMPEITGLDLIRKLKELNYKGIFVIISSLDSCDFRKQLQELNIKYYLQKPISKASVTSLFETIENENDSSEQTQ